MKWNHSFGFDLSGSNGNTDSLGVGFRMDSLYANDFQELDLYLSHNNRSTNGVSDLEETKAGAEYDSIFSEDMAWYLKGDFENDPIEQIELRATGATGLKHAWIEEENYELFVRGGLAVRHEQSLFPPFHPPPIPPSTLVLNIPINSTRSSPLKVAFPWFPGLMIFPTISSIMISPCFSPSTMEIFGTFVPAFPVAMIPPWCGT